MEGTKLYDLSFVKKRLKRREFLTSETMLVNKYDGGWFRRATTDYNFSRLESSLNSFSFAEFSTRSVPPELIGGYISLKVPTRSLPLLYQGSIIYRNKARVVARKWCLRPLLNISLRFRIFSRRKDDFFYWIYIYIYRRLIFYFNNLGRMNDMCDNSRRLISLVAHRKREREKKEKLLYVDSMRIKNWRLKWRRRTGIVSKR